MQKVNGNGTLRNTVEIWRIFLFGGLVSIVFLYYTFRLFNLQIVQGPQWSAQAEENRIREINTPAQRGLILDRNNYVLAQNIASYNVIITPASLPDDAGATQEILRQLSQLIKVPINRSDVTTENPYAPCRSD